MLRSRFGRSLVAFSLLALTRAAPARATGPFDLAEDAQAVLSGGLSLLRRVLHLPQGEQVVSHAISVSRREATLEFETGDQRTRAISLRSGRVLVDGTEVGRYTPGGALERSWRRLLADAAALDARAVMVALRAWRVEGIEGGEQEAKASIDEAVRSIGPAPAVPPARRPAVASAPGAVEPAPEEPAGFAMEPVPPLEFDEVPSAVEVASPRGALDRVFRDVSNVVAVFVACAMLGFGAVFFARRYVEVVADTATHSFGRSLVVGLLGQLLLLPTFAMLVVGLVFTIVGILLLPFAVLAYVVAACAAAVGGYLAVAHAIGETFTRRRMAHGAFVRAPNAYGYLFSGLVGLLGLWAAAALTGWMGPVVLLFRVAAVIVTWLAATVGFGAVLLSRAGLRETFAGRNAGEMTDEYLWATPPATPTAGRMRTDRK